MRWFLNGKDIHCLNHSVLLQIRGSLQKWNKTCQVLFGVVWPTHHPCQVICTLIKIGFSNHKNPNQIINLKSRSGHTVPL